MVLLSSLWSYDLAKGQLLESGVSSIYRDRLVQISGKSAKEIIEEVKIRANLISILLEKNIKDIKDVTRICRKFVTDRQAAINELGLKKEDLLRT